MGSCKNRLIQAGAERFIAKLKVPTTQARTMIPPTPGGSCGTESKASRFQKVNSQGCSVEDSHTETSTLELYLDLDLFLETIPLRYEPN